MVKHFKDSRLKRKQRSRVKIFGTDIRPRVTIFRSNKQLFVQLIDDNKKQTIIGVSDLEIAKKEKNKIMRASLLGEQISKKALELKIAQIVFDRSGYTYHGRIKALAEGLRKGGLKF
jgi:large subunit ribosomal protein L18